MNILYLCDEYPPGRHGGIGTAVQLLAREMVKMGHHVVVAGFYEWGYGGDDEFDDNGVKVYRFRRKLASPLLSKQDHLHIRIAYKLLNLTGQLHMDVQQSMKRFHIFLEQLIKTHSIDIVEMPDFNDYVRFCKRYISFPVLSVPTIVKLHGSITYIFKNNGWKLPGHIWQMEHDILAQATSVVAVSRYTAKKTAEYLNYDGPVTIIHNGIDTAVAPTSEIKKANRVIFAGALSENKGVFQLARAWNIVNEKIPEATLQLVGKGPQKKIKALLSSQASKTVSFSRYLPREELLKNFAESAVAVFPSYAETFGLAPIEAMACGTATIFTARTSGPEIIQDGVTGLLTDPGNIEQIAEKIIYLLKQQDVCSEIAKRGRTYVLQNFDIKVVARKNLDHYQSLINH